MDEPQIVYIEEQYLDYDNSSDPPNTEESKCDIILRRLDELEMKIMSRMDILETCFVKQSQRIDEVLFGLLGTDINRVQDTVIAVINDNEETNVSELNTEEDCNENTNKRKAEEEDIVVSDEVNENKKQRYEPVVIEAYTEEKDVPVVTEKMVSVDRGNGAPKSINDFLNQLPFTSIDDLRKFNKSLQNQMSSDIFVNFLKRSIRFSYPNEIPEKVLRTVISEQILIESTWASKASGKLRISYLTNFLKCCLRLGFLYSNTFNLELVRTKIMEVLHKIRVENGLAPPQAMKRQKNIVQ